MVLRLFYVCTVWSLINPVSSGCLMIGLPHSTYSRGITEFYRILADAVWFFTISTPLPSLSIKLGLASCAKHSNGLCISFQNSPVFKNITKRQKKKQAWLSVLYFKGLVTITSVGLFNVNCSNYLLL